MQNYNGFLEDNRGQQEQNKNYSHEELFGSSTTKWLTKKEADKSESLFPIRDQKRTSACVPFSMVTALFNTENVKLSPGYLYTQRVNKPSEGCYYYDIANLIVNQGVVEESEMETPTTEVDINKLVVKEDDKKKASKHKQASYVFLNDPDIDTLASLSNKGIALGISIFATSQEWSTDYPTTTDISITPNTAPINHAICVLPNTGFKVGGIKHIKIQDSSHFGGLVFRDLSQQWVAKRVKHGIYFIDLSFEDTTFPQELRGYTWNRDLTIGSRGIEVQMLQKFLRYKGFFPKEINGVPFECTEYFGGITRKAVKDYQIANNIKPTHGYFGPLTRTEVNKECW